MFFCLLCLRIFCERKEPWYFEVDIAINFVSKFLLISWRGMESVSVGDSAVDLSADQGGLDKQQNVAEDQPEAMEAEETANSPSQVPEGEPVNGVATENTGNGNTGDGEVKSNSVDQSPSRVSLPATTGEVTAAEEVGDGANKNSEPAAKATAEVVATDGTKTAEEPTTAPAPTPAAPPARSSRKRGWDRLDDPSDPGNGGGGKSFADLSPAQKEYLDRAKKFCAEQTAAFKASQAARQQALIPTPQMPTTFSPQLQLQKALQSMQQNAQQTLQNVAQQSLQNAVQQQVAAQQQAQQHAQQQIQQQVAQLQAQQQQQQAAVAAASIAAAGGQAGMAKRVIEMQEQSQRQRAFQLMCRVYVGSINFDMKEDQVKQAFVPFGPIRSIDLAWDNVAMKHKGFAFVEYDCPEAAQIALDQMNGVMLGGRNIKCGRPSSLPAAAPVIAQMQTEAESYNRIYVASIHPDLNETDVKSVFEAFGKIKEIQLATEGVGGKHKGYAFIEYDTKQASTDAIASMNLFDLGGQFLRVGKCLTPPIPPGQNPQTSGGGLVPPVSVAAAAAAASSVPGAAQAQLAVSAIQSRLAGLDNTTTSTPTSGIGGLGGLAGLGGMAAGIGGLGGLAPGLGGVAGLGGVGGLAGLAGLGQLGQLANAANLLRAANLPGLASGLNLGNAQAQTQLANAQAAAAAITGQSAASAPSAAPLIATAPPTAAEIAAKQGKPEAALSTEENIAISGTNARFMLMQKLQRSNESTVVVLRDMVAVEDLDEELESEVTEECSRHGKVQRVVIYQERQGEEDDAEVIVKIFVRFFEHDSAVAAIKALDNRWFGGRVIKAETYAEEKFESNDLSG
eukprot:scpid68305/ scgid33395/ Poly(U)-binding-splicing factor PUF60-B